jgi:putative chitinase
MARFFTIRDINLVDFDRLVKLLPNSEKGWFFFMNRTRGRYIMAMLNSWEELDGLAINTAPRLAHFIAQGLIETGWLQFAEEGLNYSAEGLCSTFRNYYPREPDGKPGRLALEHARKPQVIANFVYGRRMGNTAPEDGWRYRGRGFFQVTGKDNYQRFSDISRIDLVATPDVLASDLKLSIKVAAAFWNAHSLNRLADENNAAAISRAINRGDATSTKKANHEDQRILWTANVMNLMTDPTRIAPAEALVQPDAAPPAAQPLKVGSRGQAVIALQVDLRSLGYDVGPADGIFGRKTELAVVGLQHVHGLPTTGVVDAATLAEIAEALADANASPSAHRSRTLSYGYT